MWKLTTWGYQERTQQCPRVADLHGFYARLRNVTHFKLLSIWGCFKQSTSSLWPDIRPGWILVWVNPPADQIYSFNIQFIEAPREEQADRSLKDIISPCILLVSKGQLRPGVPLQEGNLWTGSVTTHTHTHTHTYIGTHTQTFIWEDGNPLCPCG